MVTHQLWFSFSLIVLSFITKIHIQIQFSYQISIPNAALTLRYVPILASGKKFYEKDEVDLFHEFVPSPSLRFDWKRARIVLPRDLPTRYYLRFEANGGISRQHQEVSLTNISLSKECFGIGMYYEWIEWVRHKHIAFSPPSLDPMSHPSNQLPWIIYQVFQRFFSFCSDKQLVHHHDPHRCSTGRESILAWSLGFSWRVLYVFSLLVLDIEMQKCRENIALRFVSGA